MKKTLLICCIALFCVSLLAVYFFITAQHEESRADFYQETVDRTFISYYASLTENSLCYNEGALSTEQLLEKRQTAKEQAFLVKETFFLTSFSENEGLHLLTQMLYELAENEKTLAVLSLEEHSCLILSGHNPHSQPDAIAAQSVLTKHFSFPSHISPN